MICGRSLCNDGGWCMIELSAGSARASIVPQMGGALAGLWAGDLPVLRAGPGQKAEGPFALACNLLVPFSNRISAGGFAFEGRRHAVTPNLPGEPYPLHGDGFQRAWQVEALRLHSATLSLPDGQIGPYRYAARAVYDLGPMALEIRLSVTNRGDIALPFGLGLHPWFPRGPETRLQFMAEGQWPETADHLPATQHPVVLDRGGAWRCAAPLPDTWINMGFSGWNGQARILQGAGAASVRLTARGLGTALVYAPSAAADFFCFEPVSHPVDAHNLPGQPGLVRLAPGQTLAASMTLTWGQTA